MRRLIALVLTVGLVACGSDATSPSATSITGTWSLKTVNGAALPFVVFASGTDKEEIVSDVFTLTANNASSGAFTQLTTFRITQNGQVASQSLPDAGTYTLNGSAVTLQFNSDSSSVTGAWSGNTITVTENGLVGVYQR
jgi:lipocalin-like protein